MRPRVLSTSSCHSFALAGDLLLYYWFERVSLESVLATRAAAEEALRQHPGGFRVLAVIQSGMAIPEVDVRNASAAIDRDVGRHIRAHATVIPGHGFWVATARSVLATVFFLSRSSYPRKVAGEPLEALDWLAQHGALDQPSWVSHLASLSASPPFASAELR